MNTPPPDSVCIRLWMSDIDRSALEKHDGKTGIILYVAACPDLPHGATHAVYQGMAMLSRPAKVIGHAKFYDGEAHPTPRPE